MDVKGQVHSSCPVLCREEPRELEKGRQMKGQVRGAVTEGYLRHAADMSDHNPDSGDNLTISSTSIFIPSTQHAGLITRQRLGLSGYCGSPISYPSIWGGLPALPQLLAADSAFGRSTDFITGGRAGAICPPFPWALRSISRLLQLPSIDLLH